MQQQFTRGLGLMVLEIAVRVFVNVRVVEKNLVVFDAGVGIGDLALPARNAFTSIPCKTIPASKVSRMW